MNFICCSHEMKLEFTFEICLECVHPSSHIENDSFFKWWRLFIHSSRIGIWFSIAFLKSRGLVFVCERGALIYYTHCIHSFLYSLGGMSCCFTLSATNRKNKENERRQSIIWDGKRKINRFREEETVLFLSLSPPIWMFHPFWVKWNLVSCVHLQPAKL